VSAKQEQNTNLNKKTIDDSHTEESEFLYDLAVQICTQNNPVVANSARKWVHLHLGMMFVEHDLALHKLLNICVTLKISQKSKHLWSIPM
jgi:hypothetical protein